MSKFCRCNEGVCAVHCGRYVYPDGAGESWGSYCKLPHGHAGACRLPRSTSVVVALGLETNPLPANGPEAIYAPQRDGGKLVATVRRPFNLNDAAAEVLAASRARRNVCPCGGGRVGFPHRHGAA